MTAAHSVSLSQLGFVVLKCSRCMLTSVSQPHIPLHLMRKNYFFQPDLIIKINLCQLPIDVRFVCFFNQSSVVLNLRLCGVVKVEEHSELSVRSWKKQVPYNEAIFSKGANDFIVLRGDIGPRTRLLMVPSLTLIPC